MESENNMIKFSDADKKKYIQASVNKVFAMLGVYEDCQKINDFENFYRYVKRLLYEFTGAYNILKVESLISLLGVIEGIYNDKGITHSEVRSLTFHCISILKKE